MVCSSQSIHSMLDYITRKIIWQKENEPYKEQGKIPTSVLKCPAIFTFKILCI